MGRSNILFKTCINKFRTRKYKKKNFSILFVVITILSCPHLWLITGFVISNTTGATSGTRTAYPSGTTEFIPVVSGVRVAQSFCVMFSWWLSVLVLLWSLYRLVLLSFMASDYQLSILKLFFWHNSNCLLRLSLSSNNFFEFT